MTKTPSPRTRPANNSINSRTPPGSDCAFCRGRCGVLAVVFPVSAVAFPVEGIDFGPHDSPSGFAAVACPAEAIDLRPAPIARPVFTRVDSVDGDSVSPDLLLELCHAACVVPVGPAPLGACRGRASVRPPSEHAVPRSGNRAERVFRVDFGPCAPGRPGHHRRSDCA